MSDKKTGLDLLREPFPDHQISKLPKPTKQQTEALKAAMDNRDFSLGIRCALCGAWHHKDVVHLDYVGHAALTDRLLDADPQWSWQPLAFANGLPAFDQSGGLWIKLTVCGVERLGYGHAAGKPGQDPGAREKEVIGDALRNAGMRFGAALDLWHKGDLHGAGEGEDEKPEPQRKLAAPTYNPAAHIAAIGTAMTGKALRDVVMSIGDNNGHPAIVAARVEKLSMLIKGAQTLDAIAAFKGNFGPDWPSVAADAEARRGELLNADLDGDHIPDQGAK